MKKNMRIYVLSDIHSPDSFQMPELKPEIYDMVLTLGDISPETLDYINFRSREIPNFGILGNHDPQDIPGLDNLHCRVIEIKGIKIAGFSGARQYQQLPNNFTEKEVHKKMKNMPYADLFISHAPPLCVSKNEDFIHQGFQAFDDYIIKHKPKYWLHGHLGRNYKTLFDQTAIHGVTEAYPLILEFDK